MANANHFILTLHLLAILQAQTVLACRYNVRETGFVNLESDQYQLYVYLPRDTYIKEKSEFAKISSEIFRDCNVKVEIKSNVQATRKMLDSLHIESFPAAVLVSPDGQFRRLQIDNLSHPSAQSLRQAFEGVISSPKRHEICQKVTKNYGVILLIEGANPDENRAAGKAAKSAIEEIRSKMDLMPKPIDHPPALVVADKESIAQEDILLWCLGLKSDKIDPPHAAVLYGRARWIGPLLKGDEITAQNLTELLLIIGLDCECGIDRSWIQGTMLPCRWSESLQARVIKSVGFDPENPMIKSEITSILRMGSFYAGTSPSQKTTSDTISSTIKARDVSMHDDRVDSSVQALLPQQDISLREDSMLQNLFYIIAGLGFVVCCGGVIILLRRQRRKD